MRIGVFPFCDFVLLWQSSSYFSHVSESKTQKVARPLTRECLTGEANFYPSLVLSFLREGS